MRPQVVTSDGSLVGRTQLTVPGGGFVYQLDVYSALRLLAVERPNLPVCGYPVRVGNDGVSITFDVAGPAARTFSASLAPSSSGIAGLSVAQGGRLIAVHAVDATTNATPDETVVLSHTGAVVTPRHTGEWRSFLERDTLSERFLTTNHPQWTLRGPTFRGLGQNNDITVDAFQGFGANAIGGGIVAPSADYALIYVTSSTTDPQGCPPAVQTVITQQWYLKQVNGSGLSPVRSDTYDHNCADTEPFFSVHPLFPGSFDAFILSNSTWSHDGRRAMFTVGRVDGFLGPVQSVVQSASPPSTVPAGLAVADSVFLAPVFSSDDSLVYWFRAPSDVSTCSRQWRRAAPPHGGQGTVTPATQAECFRFRHLPNAPPAIARSGRPTGFDLFRPAGRLSTAPRPIVARGN